MSTPLCLHHPNSLDELQYLGTPRPYPDLGSGRLLNHEKRVESRIVNEGVRGETFYC